MAKFTDGSGVSRLWTRIQTLISNAISAIRFHGDAFYSTDGANLDSITQDCNSLTANGLYYYTSNGPSTAIGATTNDGSVFVQGYNDNWVSQIAQDYRTGNLFIRSRNSGVWTPWRAVPKSSDLSSKMNVDGSNGGGSIGGIAFNSALGATKANPLGAVAEGGVIINSSTNKPFPETGSTTYQIIVDTSLLGWCFGIDNISGINYAFNCNEHYFITVDEYLNTPTDSIIKEYTVGGGVGKIEFIARSNGKLEVVMTRLSSGALYLYEDRVDTFQSMALGYSSHVEGCGTTASGNYSHAEGSSTRASNSYSHAEGSATCAKGTASHAEGSATCANGNYSHAEGSATCAKGTASHAEGVGTTASGDYSHAEGRSTHAFGNYSHAGFDHSYTEGEGSFVHARNGIARNAGQVIFGYLGGQEYSPRYSSSTSDTATSRQKNSMFSINSTNIEHATNRYGDPPHNNESEARYKSYTNALLDVDVYGNMFLTGHMYKARGKLVGVLVANGRNISLDNGAIYVLYVAGWITSTRAFRGINAYVIAAGMGTSTTALATPKIASIGTTGTVCCRLSSTYSSSGSSYYSPVLGIGCCTTAITIRYTLQKVCGSMSDFND